MGKVEPQTIGGNQRTGLLNMLPQHRAKSRLEQMGGGVITGRCTAGSAGNGQIDCITNPYRPFLDMAVMYNQVTEWPAAFHNLQMSAAGRENAAVTGLPA